MSWMDDKDIIDITEKLKGGGGDMFNMNKFETYLPLVILIAFLLSWGWTGVKIVEPDEVGVVLTFGKYSRIAQPGLNFIIPFPVQEMRKESIKKIRRVEIGFESRGFSSATGKKNYDEALMLTGDENIVAADMIVQYKVNNPQDYIFNVSNQELTVKKAAEAALREVVGTNKIDAVLTDERQKIQDDITTSLRALMKNYGIGVEIINVQLQDVFPPKEVEHSFFDVASAREDREKLVNEAEGYRNDIVPKAKGDASAVIEQAKAYREQVVKNAEGETNRFLKILKAYTKAKKITRTRLYLETMEKVFRKSKKVIIDGKAMEKTIPYMPINPNELKGGK